MSPRLHVGFDHASGDRNPDNNRLNTFNQLFPLGHAYHGHIDMIGRQNVVAYSTGLTLHPVDVVRVHTTVHHFRRASTRDAVYNAGGGVVREGDAGNASEVGTELDLRVIWSATPKTSLMTGISRFWSGDFIKESGPHKDITFMYVSVQQDF